MSAPIYKKIILALAQASTCLNYSPKSDTCEGWGKLRSKDHLSITSAFFSECRFMLLTEKFTYSVHLGTEKFHRCLQFVPEVLKWLNYCVCTCSEVENSLLSQMFRLISLLKLSETYKWSTIKSKSTVVPRIFGSEDIYLTQKAGSQIAQFKGL